LRPRLASLSHALRLVCLVYTFLESELAWRSWVPAHSLTSVGVNYWRGENTVSQSGGVVLALETRQTTRVELALLASHLEIPNI
jgi:hypothetical protein